MMPVKEGLYVGTVVHTRVRPVRHKLRYRVFSLLVDCAQLDALDRRLKLFSHNRANLLAIHDRDHGNAGPLTAYLAALAGRAGYGDSISRFLMLCYPRILGHAFNPVTVYFGLNADGRVRLTIYEVNNTFGERMTYVLPAEAGDDGLIVQRCAKRHYVSPFNPASGTYDFHITPPGEHLTVGVALRDDGGPVMKAHFRAERRPLTDANLMRALARTGWMTLKVTAGIRYEAAKLWLKGLRPAPRPSAPKRAIRLPNPPKEAA